jgi:hypothetical protein
MSKAFFRLKRGYLPECYIQLKMIDLQYLPVYFIPLVSTVPLKEVWSNRRLPDITAGSGT